MNVSMEEDFFDIWWRREGSRLLLADGKIPNLEDYVKAAFLAGYRKRVAIEKTINELRAGEIPTR
jgi:hypothetical protein